MTVVTGHNYKDNSVTYRAFETNDLFGAKYQAKNDAGKIGFLSCVFCGRDTSKQGNSQGVYVGAGGGLIVYPQDYDKAIDGGDMGWFPVGSECIKQVPAEFRVPNPYSDKVRGI